MKILKAEREWYEFGAARVIFTDNTAQNICHRLKKLSKIREEKKTLLYVFESFSTAIALPSSFEIFLIFPNFLKS